MKRRIKKYYHVLLRFGKVPFNSTSHPGFTLEHINYNAFLFTASIFSLFSCIFNYIGIDSLLLVLFTFFSSSLLALLYYLARFKSYYNLWLTAFTMLFVLSVTWFMNGGANGSTSLIYILALIMFTIIARRDQQNLIFCLFLSNISILCILEFYYSKALVHSYTSLSNYYLDMIFVFSLVFISSFFTTRFFKRSFDAERDKVNNQKIIIEEQNKEHMASLTYASSLQKKIISEQSQLHVLFQEYFVFFKPRDIVSGDFFWIKQKDHYGIVVVADCTGHGVPAAFLSILGISFFEEIILQETEALNAGLILENIRDKFNRFLQKNDSTIDPLRDGIDLGIFIVNYQDNCIQYAGANRSLLLVRNNAQPQPPDYKDMESTDEHTLYSFKATKNTIGFNYIPKSFIRYDINLCSGDSFYMFSDGYCDQFDAANRKKYNVSRFKKELLSVQHLNMSDQCDHFSHLHAHWKGKTDQTDDILLMGLRI